jgi:hypothetical protein
MRLAFQLIPAVICAIPLGAWAGASLYASAPRGDDLAAASVSVERANKGSRLVQPFGTGAEGPQVEVEVNGRLDAAITLRDRDGQVIYRADPANHVTTMAKHAAARRPATAPKASGPESESKAPVAQPASAWPEGCEGAFSPYAAPRMAHVIGRCISALEPTVHFASLAN